MKCMAEYAFSVEGIGQDISRCTHGSVAGPRPPMIVFAWRRPTFADGDGCSHSSHMFLRATSHEAGESSLRGCPKDTLQYSILYALHMNIAQVCNHKVCLATPAKNLTSGY